MATLDIYSIGARVKTQDRYLFPPCRALLVIVQPAFGLAIALALDLECTRELSCLKTLSTVGRGILRYLL